MLRCAFRALVQQCGAATSCSIMGLQIIVDGMSCGNGL